MNPKYWIAGRCMLFGIICTIRRLGPLFSVLEPAPANPYFFIAQMHQRGRQFSEIAVICLRFLGHGKKMAAEHLRPAAELLGDLVVQLVLGHELHGLGRGLGRDRLDANSVDELALKLTAGSVQLDLVPGPVVTIAERFFEYFPISSIEHQGFSILEVQNMFLLLILSLPDCFLGKVRDHRDDWLCLHIVGLDEPTRERFILTHNSTSFRGCMMMMMS